MKTACHFARIVKLLNKKLISPAGASYLLDRETEKKRDETSFSPIEQQIGRYYYYLML